MGELVGWFVWIAILIIAVVGRRNSKCTPGRGHGASAGYFDTGGGGGGSGGDQAVAMAVVASLAAGAVSDSRRCRHCESL